MSVQSNKAAVRRFYEEAWGKGNLDAAEIFAEDYVRHDLRATQALPGPEGQKRIAADFRAAFPDLEFRVDLILGEGDLVAGRWTARGTHTGRWGGLAPTGKSMEFGRQHLPIRGWEGRGTVEPPRRPRLDAAARGAHLRRRF